LKASTPKAQSPKCVLLGASAGAAAPAAHATGSCHTATQPQRVCLVLQHPVTQGEPRETLCLQGGWGAPLIFLLLPRELPTEQGHHPRRGYSRGCLQKNHGRDPIFPAPYYPENSQSSRFEGANPPTAVFLVMTHKIPHNSDTIFLIKPAARTKLYIWYSKKKKGRGKKKDKTLLVLTSSEAVGHETDGQLAVGEPSCWLCTDPLQTGARQTGSAARHQESAFLYVVTYTDVRIISCIWTEKGAFISRMT